MKKAVKIVPVYLGIRRSDPLTAIEAHQCHRAIASLDAQVDPGVEMDTVWVINNLNYKDHYNNYCIHQLDSQAYNLQEFTQAQAAETYSAKKAILAARDAVNWVKSLNRTKTIAGVNHVLERANLGLAFGAYSHAFDYFRTKYEYWFLLEDDHAAIRNGYFKAAINMFERNSNVGFVNAIRMCYKQKVPFAAGSCGFARQGVLDRVARLHPDRKHPAGHLPFYPDDAYAPNHWFGEVRLTSSIYNLGYDLVDHPMDKYLVCFGRTASKCRTLIHGKQPTTFVVGDNAS